MEPLNGPHQYSRAISTIELDDSHHTFHGMEGIIPTFGKVTYG
jgi:hypothetical protein